MAQRGLTIDNKYEILKEIGRGGMSVVYLAMDKRLNKQWAVKEIKKQVNDENNDVIVQDLLTEANLMKRLDHPALPRIVDIIDNGEIIYIIMDYIEGESLDRIVNKEGAQSQEIVLDWAKQLCDVLSYLHRQNPPIIYRDMKPSNVILKPEGKLKLIDFGIAREYKQCNNEDTKYLGTKGYAAPEQFGGMGQTDLRTDIYCLGVTLYHLVTGHNPTEYPYEIYPIRKWNPSLSPGFEKIIAKCTQMNPSDRYQSCDELMYALDHYMEIDDKYIKKQKKNLMTFICVLSTAIICFLGSSVFNYLALSENNSNYEQLIGISSSSSYEMKIEKYTEAIMLYPSRFEAYNKLLQTYIDSGKFQNKESNQFISLYNDGFGEKNNDNFDITSNEFAKLNYMAGTTYLYLYSEDTGDISIKTNAIKALPFFENIVNNSGKEYENYNLAESYFTMCSFYKEYIGDVNNINEPTKQIYDNLINAIRQNIYSLDDYDYSNLSYIKLTVYESTIDMIYDQRKGLCATGVDKKTVLDLFNIIYDNTENMPVSQAKNISKQEEILEKMDNYMDEIEVAYGNIIEK